MEPTVEKLEAMFNKAESDLDFLHRKLENECGAYCNDEQTNQVNPVQLLDRISEIKGEYHSILEDAKEIQKVQAEAMMFFRDNLTNTCKALMKLQMNSGLEVEKPEELDKLEEMLGITVPEPSDATSDKNSGDQKYSLNSRSANGSETHLTQTNVISGKVQTTTAPSLPDKCTKDPFQLSPLEVRQQSEDFLEVTQKEFDTVSSLIRGRVKLTDVNQAYQTIWQHFKENPDSDPLTPTDMHKMGLKVTGKTGDAKLKVLRALKLLHIAKNGSIKLP